MGPININLSLKPIFLLIPITISADIWAITNIFDDILEDAEVFEPILV